MGARKSTKESRPDADSEDVAQPSAADAPEEPRASFEQAMARLAEIVEALEGGDLPLERSLALFEEGVRLSRAAQSRLDGAERRVQELLGVDEAGRPVTRELEP